jgi:hypothetical protein
MPSGALDGCLGKIERAEQHLADLDTRTMRFLENNVVVEGTFIGQHNKELSQQIMKVRFPQPPIMLSIIAGEIAYHLRSSLDHLLWQLVILNKNRPIPGKSEFPIFWDREKYKTSGVGKIKGVSGAAAARIEGLQPYHRGPDFKAHALMALHELEGTDKHQMLAVVVNTIGIQSAAIALGPRDSIEIASRPAGGTVRIRPDEETPFLVVELPADSNPMNMKTKASI